jgi:uncharacterized membrane protein
MLLSVSFAGFLSVAVFSAAQSTQGACTEITLSPYSSYALGIDNAGDVVGYYQNESGGNDGFLRTANGNETIIDYPGFDGATQAYAINNAGEVAGTAGANVFIYNIAAQTFSTVNLQGMSNTGQVAINDSGTIAGTTSVNGTGYGYMLQGSNFKLLSPPGATGASAYGISQDGTVIGSATLANGSNIYYRYLNGKYAEVNNLPGLAAISPSATVLAGYTTNQYGTDVGFIHHGKSGFNFQCDSGETVALGVNDSGQAVGFYGFTGDPFLMGFVWTPTMASQQR